MTRRVIIATGIGAALTSLAVLLAGAFIVAYAAEFPAYGNVA